MAVSPDPRPRGLLDPRAGPNRYEESIHRPARDLAELVAHCWCVRWDLRGQEPHLVQVLPSPSVQLVFEGGRSRVHGVGTRRFTTQLKDAGDILGVAFRPAGFRPFAMAPVSTLTDRVVPGTHLFGPDADALAERLASLDAVAQRVKAAETFIRGRLPPPDPNVPAVNQIVDQVALERSIVTVDDIARRARMGRRTLQRLFREYVGVTPKWVIQCYRLHEAADRLSSDEDVDLAALALDLGYADQAHFARDFRAVVGRSPAAYERDARRDD